MSSVTPRWCARQDSSLAKALLIVLGSLLWTATQASAQPLPERAQPGRAAAGASPVSAARVVTQPLTFEDAGGNTDAARKFVSRGPAYTVTLTPDGAALTLSTTSSTRERTLRMNLIGAIPSPRMAGDQPSGKIYHATSSSLGTLDGSATYRRVRYSNVYPGIDQIYYGNDRQLEFDFLVAPNVDAGR